MNDAGSAFIGVEPDLRGFGRQLAGQVDPHIDKSAAHVESRFGGAFSAVAKIAGGIFAAKFGVDLFKDVIGGASDLNETISKSNTIFGGNAKEIEDWASSAAKSIGQSKQGALDAAATFGNLFVQLGTGSGEAAKMSKEMVGLASDFASFHNADPSDVIESMTAAFRGEYDAVQRYVPTITAAAVEQQALKMGLAASTKELTAQDKALATQALLMQGAGAAVGDFARTSDGLANRQRILSAQFQDMKDRIGTALLPVVLRLMEGFLGLGRVVGPIATQVGTAIQFLRSGFLEGNVSESTGLMGVLVRFGAIGRQVVDFVRDNMTPVLAGLAVVIVAALVPAVSALTASLATLFSPVILVVAAIAAVAAGLVYAYTHFEGFRDVVDGVVQFLIGTVLPKVQQFASYIAEQFANLVGWVREHWASIQEAIGHVVVVVQAIIANFVAAVQLAWKTWGDEILNIARIVWDQIKTVVETTINIVRGIIETVVALINGDWGRAWDAIKGILSDAWEGIKTTAANALKLLREGIEGGISGVVTFMKEVPGKILDALGNMGSLLAGAGKNLIEGLIGGITSMAKAAADAAWDVVKGAVKAAWDAVVPGSPSKVGRAIGENFGSGIAAGIAGSGDWVERSATALMGDAIASASWTNARLDLPSIRLPNAVAPSAGLRRTELTAGSSSMAPGLGSGHITIEVPVYLNGREIARATAKDVARELHNARRR